MSPDPLQSPMAVIRAEDGGTEDWGEDTLTGDQLPASTRGVVIRRQASGPAIITMVRRSSKVDK